MNKIEFIVASVRNNTNYVTTAQTAMCVSEYQTRESSVARDYLLIGTR